MNKKEIGKDKEEIAKNFLINLGYEWICSNFRTKSGEIDLIFKDNNILVAVEVKYRKNKFEIERNIDEKKINKIKKSLEIFVNNNSISFKEIRIDAIFIFKECGELAIKYYKNYN